MPIETLNDIVEEMANRLGVYGTCVANDEHGHQVRECLPGETCRICFEIGLKSRIHAAVEIERKLATPPNQPAEGE